MSRRQGIDLWSFNSLIKVFEKMRDEINGTILIISHQERILDIADKIIVIADGQVRKTRNQSGSASGTSEYGTDLPDVDR